MYNRSLIKYYLASIFQSIIIGLSFLAIKIGLSSVVNILDLLTHRFTIAVIGIVIITIINKNKKTIKLNDFIKIAPYGLIFPIGVFLSQTIGLKYISSSESGVISALTPIITLIISFIILNEKITTKQLLFMVISVSGVIFINTINGINSSNYNLFGVFMILIYVVCLSLYSVFIKKLSYKYSAFQISIVLNIVGFIFFTTISITKHITEKSISNFFTPIANYKYLISIIFLGICSSLLTSILNAYALKKLQATTIGLIGNISTIVSIIAGVIILDDNFYWYHTVVITLILTGTIGFSLSKK